MQKLKFAFTQLGYYNAANADDKATTKKEFVDSCANEVCAEALTIFMDSMTGTPGFGNCDLMQLN
jgi:hypothetical protein